jgi:hypothetical protein
VKDIAESHHNIPRSRVTAALTHLLDEPERRRKHAGLDKDREQQILAYVRQNAEEDTALTKGEITDYYTN